MEMTVSMFATSADYWKARAEMSEQLVREIANELGCCADNETILMRIADLNEDKDRLDRIELYHREMDDFDRRSYPGKTMWVLFADNGVQGKMRRIIDASIPPETTQAD